MRKRKTWIQGRLVSANQTGSNQSSLRQREVSKKIRNFKDFILPLENTKVHKGAIKIDDSNKN